MAGLEARLRAELRVPVVDSVAASVKLAETLVSLGLSTSKVNAYRPVQPRQNEGLPPHFRAIYGDRSV
jgi:allantoin racemase